MNIAECSEKKRIVAKVLVLAIVFTSICMLIVSKCHIFLFLF